MATKKIHVSYNMTRWWLWWPLQLQSMASHSHAHIKIISTVLLKKTALSLPHLFLAQLANNTYQN